MTALENTAPQKDGAKRPEPRGYPNQRDINNIVNVLGEDAWLGWDAGSANATFSYDVVHVGYSGAVSKGFRFVEAKSLPPQPLLPMAWVSRFLSGADQASTVAGLSSMFANVNRIASSGNYEVIDEFFELGDPTKYSHEFAVGMLRATFSYRKTLANWTRWRDATCAYLVREKLEAHKILRGLFR